MSVYIAESEAGTAAGIHALLEACWNGVIGLHAQFAHHPGNAHPYIALLALAVIPAVPSRHPKPTHSNAPPSATHPDIASSDVLCSFYTHQPDTLGCSQPHKQPGGGVHVESHVAKRHGSRGAPFLLLVRLSKMGCDMPPPLRRLLYNRGLTFAAVNWHAGESLSLQHAQEMGSTYCKLPGVDARAINHFDLEMVTGVGFQQWGRLLKLEETQCLPISTAGCDWLVNMQLCSVLVLPVFVSWLLEKWRACAHVAQHEFIDVRGGCCLPGTDFLFLTFKETGPASV